MNAEDCFHHIWLISDPLVRSESGEFEEKNSNSNEIEKDGDDPIVESFFIDNDTEWILKFFIYLLPHTQ